MKFRDYINEMNRLQANFLADVIAKREQKPWKALGTKPKKGDFVKDFDGILYQIDMVSRGYVYTEPPKGSIERGVFAITELKPNKKEKYWYM